MIDSTDHIAGKAGLTLTITASKNGAAFAAITPVVTDLGSGWYNLALTAVHTDTAGDFALHATGTGADPQDALCQIVAYDPADAAGLGLSRVDAAISTRSTYAGGAVASVTADVSITQAAADKVWASVTRLLTAGTNIALAKGVGVTGFNDITATGAATATWDELTATARAVGSYGQLVKDNLNATVSSRNSGNVTVSAFTAGAITTAAFAVSAIDATVLATSANVAIANQVRDTAYEGSYTLKHLVQLIAAVSVGKATGNEGTTPIFRNPSDTVNAVSATVDASGNRSALTYVTT